MAWLSLRHSISRICFLFLFAMVAAELLWLNYDFNFEQLLPGADYSLHVILNEVKNLSYHCHPALSVVRNRERMVTQGGISRHKQ